MSVINVSLYKLLVKSGLTAFIVENGVTPAGTPGAVLGSFYTKENLVQAQQLP
jgi:hypothetical protein